MIPKRPARPRELTDRDVYTSMTVNGRRVERGTELHVAGIRGRVAFVSHTRRHDGTEWVDVQTSKGRSRVIRPDAIRTVHTTRQLAVLSR